MSSRSKKKQQQSAKEAAVLEELFLDQLRFKLNATVDLYTFEPGSKKEILSFIKRLDDLSKENINLLKKI